VKKLQMWKREFYGGEDGAERTTNVSVEKNFGH
jgi:hypothetical protein